MTRLLLDASLVPAYSGDAGTMSFTSDRAGLFPGSPAIDRASRDGAGFGAPELAVRGKVREASITADGRRLCFIHILSDLAGNFDADLRYVEITP